MVLVEKQSDAEFLNNGFYSPDKTFAQCEWEQITWRLETSIFVYLFQISQDLDLVMPPKSLWRIPLFLYKTTALTGNGGFDCSHGPECHR